MANNPYFNNFIPAGSQSAAGTHVTYGASAGQPVAGYSAGGTHSAQAGQTSYDTSYPNSAAFAAGYYGFPPKSNYDKNYFPGPGPAGPGKPDGHGLPPAHYQGYEAALFNAAQAYLHHQTGPGGPKPGGGGGGKGSGSKSRRGGFFNGGGGGNGQSQRSWASNNTQQLHYCEVCKISCASPQTYKDHLDGQKHKKKEVAIRSGQPMVPTPRTGAALHCELCNVTCTSSDAYAAHIRGTKHQKVVKLHTKLGKPIPPAEPQLIHASKSGSGAAASTSTATAATAATGSPVKVVVAGAPKINFLGGNYLTTSGSKPAETSTEIVAADTAAAALSASPNSAPAAASQEKKDGDAPITAASATETAMSVVAQWEEERVIHPVGQDYVEELHGPDGKINGFNCRLCDCRFNDVNAKDMHLKGRRHRLMYKKKVDPNLVVEAKGWPALRQKKVQGPWQERKKGRDPYWEGGEGYEDTPPGHPPMEEGQHRPIPPGPGGFWPNPSRGPPRVGHAMGLPPPPQYFPAGHMQMGMVNPSIRKPETPEDRHVIAKHAELYPSEMELESIQVLVSYVERALKLVSDQLTSQTQDSTAEPSPPATTAANGNGFDSATAVSNRTQAMGAGQPQRMLKGVMRVGLLAKGLLLKGDRNVQLVVLCSAPPTFHLLDLVSKNLPAHLSVVAPSVTFVVEPFPNEAYVQVKSTKGHGIAGDVIVKVSLTSPVVREEQLAAAAAAAVCNGSNGVDVDMKEESASNGVRLNTKDCLNALALLRQAKWFQARANSLQNCVLVIRIMRDFCLRSPVWSSMEFWAMELIVERACFSAGGPLSPGDALRRVFETISSGLLLCTGDGCSPGISDPCEKDTVDALGNLTAQERDDMTASAQHALRQIAFRQIHRALGMAKPLPMNLRNFKPPVTSSAPTAALSATTTAPSLPTPSSSGPPSGKKRPRENSQSDVISPEGEVPADLKKEKIEVMETESNQI